VYGSFEARPVRYRILGPLEVGEGDSPTPIAAGKQRALLALLLLHANEVVPVDRLIDELWGDEPPETAAKSVQVHVSRLRKTLRANGATGAGSPGDGGGSDGGDDVVVTRSRGYMIRVEPEDLDLRRFEDLLAAGDVALGEDDPDGAEKLLTQALALWRGPALADVAFGSFAQHELGRLDELRLRAQEQRIEARLALGRNAEVIGELEPLTAEHPLKEGLRGQLMLALYRSGRQAEALDAYRATRRALVEELGIEPSSGLQALEHSILRQDPALDRSTAPTRDRGLRDAAQPLPPKPEPRDTPSAQQDRRPRRIAVSVAAGALAMAGLVVLFASGDRDGGATADPNSVALIDTETNELVDDVPVGAEPTDVAVTGGSVWVANAGDDTVSQIDERTHRVDATIAPGIAVDAMAAGEGAVWASDNRRGLVARIDPNLSTVDRSIRIDSPNSLFNRSTPLVTGAGSVWAVNAGSAVARIDPRGRRVETEIPVGSGPKGIAAGEGGIWVADDTESTVTRIDPATSGVAATIPVGHGASGIAAGEGGVWVANTLDDAVVQIDPETNSATNTIPVGAAPTGVAVGAGAVWVANSGSGTVSRIDPGAGRVAATIDVGERPQGLTVSGDRVWVSVQATPPSSREPAGGDPSAQLVLYREHGAESEAQPTDPALALPSTPTVYATTAMLLNYPDRPFPEGARLRPDVAEAMPEVTDSGKTYTFHLRDDFRFSPPSNQPVTAAAFERAIERSLDPRMGSYAAELVDDIVGLREYQTGRASDIAGVTARGDTLRIRLTAPSPTFPARLATHYFSAVPPNTPTDPGGIAGIPSAGPYYVAATDPLGGLVLKRNPNYGGDRPAELSEINIVPDAEGLGIDDVEAGRADAIALTPDEQEEAGIEAEYGAQSEAARAGDQRYFSYPTLFSAYLALNTQRPLLSSAAMRRAVNYAIDRPALAREPNQALSGQPTDQYIPPGMRGYRDAEVYPLDGPDVATAKRLAGNRGGNAVMYTCTDAACRGRAEIIRANLEEIGIEVEIRQFSIAGLYGALFRPNEPWDIADTSWIADYADPFQAVNILFSPGALSHLGGFDDPYFQRKMQSIASLTGPSRYRAYARLDAELARENPPAAAYATQTKDYFFSARMGCQINQPVYGLDLGALCVQP
jgi:YVTN family beta-propeller protein